MTDLPTAELVEALDASQRETLRALGHPLSDHFNFDALAKHALRAPNVSSNWYAATAITMAAAYLAAAARLKALDEAMGNLHTEVMKEIAAEHRALDEWRENGGPDWRDDHPAIMRLKRLQTFAAAARAARGGK